MEEEKFHTLMNATYPACEWLKKNGNPHQAIVIEWDKVRVVSDELGVPTKQKAE